MNNHSDFDKNEPHSNSVSLTSNSHGKVALAIAKNSNNPTAILNLNTAMMVASSLPDNKLTQTVGTIQAVTNAAQAANQGSMLGVGMALASAVPGSDFSDVMGKVQAVSSAIAAANQGSLLGVGTALASIDPTSSFGKSMGKVSQAMDILNTGLSIIKPKISPADLMMNINPSSSHNAQPTASVSKSSGGVQLTGNDGAYIKGEGLKCEACALANQEAQIGAPVQALYGSKILVGGDDIDYMGKGYLPFVMSRIYNSQNTDVGWFGQGWTTQGYEQRLELDPQHNRIYLVDNTGRRVPFTYLAPGHRCYQPYEGITLYRKPLAECKKDSTASSRPILADATNSSRIGEQEPLEFVLYQGDYQPNGRSVDTFNGVAQYYSYVTQRCHHGTHAVVLLSGYSDKYGHKIQLYYTHHAHHSHAHLPQYITDESGGCYEFEFTTKAKQTRLAKLYQIKAANKRVICSEYQYSEEGDLIKVSKLGRVSRQFAYKNHLMTWQLEPSGQEAAYVYDQYDQPKTARVIEHALSSGRHYRFTYDRDDAGQGITLVTEQPGSELERTHRFEYDKWHNMTSLTDPNGNTTHYRYDDLNRTVQIIRPNDSHINLNYQGKFLNSVAVQIGINEITGLASYRETEYQYNQAGQITAITDALGNNQRFEYNQQGNLITSIDPMGHITRYSYDQHGNLTQQTLANGSQYTFDYDEVGNLIAQTDCSGYQTQYRYDKKHRLQQIINAQGDITQYYYDDSKPWLDNLISQVSYPDGSRIRMAYDHLGRLTSHTDAQEHQTKYDYGSDNLPKQRTQSSSNSTVTRINQAGQQLSYSYDELRRLIRLTNENGENWTFVYDKADNLIAETRFDGHQSQYRYNALGQMTHQIDNPHLPRSRQRHTHLEHDLSGQLIAKHSSHYPELINSSTAHNKTKADKPSYHRSHFDYNLIGQLICATNQHSRIDLTYDAAGRLTSETLISHIAKLGQYQERIQTLTHHYDEIGNRIKTILPDGKEIKQQYYGSGHLYNQSLYHPEQDQHIELRHSERNKLHQETRRYQGKITSTYEHDPMGRLIKQHSQNENHLTIERQYHYDNLGHLTHLSGHSQIGQQQTNTYIRGHQYQYDAQGRLKEHKHSDHANHTGMTEVFAFDPASNRIPVQTQTPDSQSSNNATNHGRPQELIQNGQKIRYTYDTHGRILYKTQDELNQANRQGIQLQYNANNELEKSLTTGYQDNKISKTLTTYHYDAFGRRIAKHSEIRQLIEDKQQIRQISKTQYKHSHYLWDSDRPLQDYSDTHVYTTVYNQSSFEPIARLVWLREDITQASNDDNKTNSQKTNEHEKATQPSHIQVFYYHNDQLGTPNELTNEQGEVIWLADYEAW